MSTAVTRPSLARLTAVELRKMADTRAGAWLLAVTGLLAAAMVVLIVWFGKPADMTFANLFTATLLPVGLLMPVLGILSVTGEWTQRSTLTTFALVPQRGRVAAAKVLAGVQLAALSVAAGLAVAAVGTLVGAAVADGSGSWHITGTTIGYGLVYQLVNVLMGIGFGMVLMNSALSIVLYYALPVAWTTTAALVQALRTPATWLDPTQTMAPLVDGGTMTSGGWARLATSVAVWALVPLAAGLVRLHNREVA